MRSNSFAHLICGKRAVAAVVPHTHWDRAWYHPFEQFRLSLGRVMRRLLAIMENDPRYRCFTSDGQTVVLEDYLELYPEDRARVARLVKAGRIAVGPFYVLPDQYLVTAESLVRNGLIGRQVADSFGACSRQGYVADPFGMVSQLPQVWAKLGLESAFFSRGLSKQQLAEVGSTFWWLAPDGESRVLGVFQAEGYANLMNWGVPRGAYPRRDPDASDLDFAFSEQQVQEVGDAYQRVGSRSRVLFFGNGNDHHGPSHRLPDLLAHNAARFPDLAFAQVTTDEFVALVKQENPDLGTLSGEMHSPDMWSTLTGTLDSRPYLKQQYDEAAAWLERRAEPLTAVVERLGLTARAVRQEHHVGYAFNVGNDSALSMDQAPAALRYAWKTLLRCSPHDDICGCSADATHEDAENRTKRVREVAEMLTSDAALRLAQAVKPPRGKQAAQILAWNGLPFARTCSLSRTMLVPASSTKLRLVDDRGRELPASLRARVVAPHFRRWNSDLFEDLPEKAVEVKLDFTAELPAMGYRAFYLQEGVAAKAPTGVKRLANGMENELVRVRVQTDGTFDLLDKRTGARYTGLNRLRDYADAGDLYVTRMLSEGVVTAGLRDGTTRCLEALPDRVTFETRLRLPKVPVTIREDRTRRSPETAPLTLRFLYTLYAHSPAVYVRAEWVNEHQEHRLTVDFWTGFATTRPEAQSAFDVVPHEAPFVQEPCRDFVTAAAGGRRLTLLSRGMHSHDVRLEKGKLVLTKCLVKANGWIHGPLRPYWAAQGGNCLRPLVMEYAVLPGQERKAWASLAQKADAFRAEPYVEHYLYPAGGTLPGAHSFLTVSGPFEVTALKRSERGDSLILRMVNLSPRSAKAVVKLSLALDVEGAFAANLLEERLALLPVVNGRLEVRAKTREIVTVELV